MKRERSYKRKSAHKSSNLIIVFCEGENTEPSYFNRFSRQESRLKIELYSPDESNPNNTPEGLLKRAKRYKKTNDLRNDDSIWLVFDSDNNTDEDLMRVRQSADAHHIYLSQSNPCFEVWLYYHYFNCAPSDAPTDQVGWKIYLGQRVPGGLDYEECYKHASEAIENAEKNFSTDANGLPTLYSTECHKLVESMLELQR